MNRLCPPPGYASWLDYAVDCMDTRSLEQQELWIDDPAQRHWPEGATREQMQQAVTDELAELRDRAKSVLSQTDSQRLLRHMAEDPPNTQAKASLERGRRILKQPNTKISLENRRDLFNEISEGFAVLSNERMTEESARRIRILEAKERRLAEDK